MNDLWDVIVIGGGQAGLASGYYLHKSRLRFLILEASKEIGGSWPSYYESLKLFSPAKFSSMPGMRFPGDSNHYPARDDVVRYLRDYHRQFKLPVCKNQYVVSVEKNSDVFSIRTESGDTFLAKAVICATGSFCNPHVPALPGQVEFKGRILHTSAYQNPDSFIDQRVVVVGGGNSAVQIAVELSEVSRTSLAVLRPIQFVQQKLWGQDVHHWLKIIGFDSFPFWRLGRTAPRSGAVNDSDGYKKRITQGKPDQRPMFVSFYDHGVIWPDGKKEAVDAVVFGTGYGSYMPFFHKLGALDAAGSPLHQAGVGLVLGLYHVGLEGQRSFSSATLRGVGPDARFIVKKLTRYLKYVDRKTANPTY